MLRQDLDDSRAEVRQMGEEIRRLKQRESTLDAECKILKSQMMHMDPLAANKAVSAPKAQPTAVKSTKPIVAENKYPA